MRTAVMHDKHRSLRCETATNRPEDTSKQLLECLRVRPVLQARKRDRWAFNIKNQKDFALPKMDTDTLTLVALVQIYVVI